MAIDPTLRLGVDLGGTKIEAVVLRAPRHDVPGSRARAQDAGIERVERAHEPEVLARKRVPTGSEAGYEHILEVTAALIRDVTREAGLAELPPIGVGMPGSVTFRRADGARSAEALVKNSNTTCLNGRPFRRDLARSLGTMSLGIPSLVFANDANCFALAEAGYGAARGGRVVFGVILGTGVGGGIVLHGRAWDGLQGIAGEWGHVVLDPASRLACYCGRRGCVERFLSGPAIEAAYAARTGTSLPLPELASRREHDADARAVLDDVVANFGRAVATVINILDPDVIVLGGGVSNLDLLYSDGPTSVARWAFTDELRTPIVKNALGDSAGVLGAALL